MGRVGNALCKQRNRRNSEKNYALITESSSFDTLLILSKHTHCQDAPFRNFQYKVIQEGGTMLKITTQLSRWSKG